MQANRGRGTNREMAVRHAAHAAGLCFRVNYRPIQELNRRADLVFTRAKVAVFVDGYFWHRCPTHHTVAKSIADFWAQKVTRNRERDAETDRLLRDAGWSVIRSWEHEPADDVVARIFASVRRG